MSEAADAAEREVEDFFTEEIFGAKPPVENEAPFPVEAPPEPKPVEEVAIDPTEGTEEGTEENPDSEETPPEQEETEAEEGTVEEAPVSEEEAHLAWARKKY